MAHYKLLRNRGIVIIFRGQSWLRERTSQSACPHIVRSSDIVEIALIGIGREGMLYAVTPHLPIITVSSYRTRQSGNFILRQWD